MPGVCDSQIVPPDDVLWFVRRLLIQANEDRDARLQGLKTLEDRPDLPVSVRVRHLPVCRPTAIQIGQLRIEDVDPGVLEDLLPADLLPLEPAVRMPMIADRERPPVR